MSSNDQHKSVHNNEIIDLMRWMKANRFRNRSKLQICQFFNSGYGLVSRKCLNAGDDVITVPVTLTINCDTLRGSVIVNDWFKDQKFLIDEWLMIYLIYEQHLGSDSFWYPYIKSLPKTTLELFRISNKNPMFIEKKQEIDEKFRKIRKKCPEQFRNLFTITKLKWVYTIVNTRSVYFDSTQFPDPDFDIDDDPKMALVPLLDMFNHCNDSGIEFSITSDYVTLTTNRFLPKNRQIFITYGVHGNKKLMLEYGFVLMPFNSLDFVQFKLEELLDFKQITKKLFEFIKDHKFDQDLYIDKNGISFNTRAILIVAENLEKSTKELTSLIFGSQPVSVVNVREICQMKLSRLMERSKMGTGNHDVSVLKSFEDSQINFLQMLLDD